MRQLEILIDLARELTQNQRYDANSGISQKLFTHYFQSAQDSLMKNIVNSKTKFFLKQEIIQVVPAQEQYDYPDDIYLQNIDTMEWSSINNSLDSNQGWIVMDRCITKDRQSVKTGYPFGYWTRHDGFMLTPPLQSGYIRLNYIGNSKRLEKRSGRITQLNGAGVDLGPGDVLTTINVDLTDGLYDPSYINMYEGLSISDKGGYQTCKDIVLDIAGPITGQIVCSKTLAAGESIKIGSYVLAGENSINRPLFPDICETYFLKYVAYVTKYGDSSRWTEETKLDMIQCFAELVDSFKLLTDDMIYPPIINADYLSMW